MTKAPVIDIPGSKSISNRLLILQALFPTLEIKGLSPARDTVLLKNALGQEEETLNVQDAGTAFRFLMAYKALHGQKPVVLTGTRRMQQRPVKPLADALEQLGAKIAYLQEEGYPPVRIYPASVRKNQTTVEAGISSQFISALMLSGAKIPGGLQIMLKGPQVSKPYVEMTARLMRQTGIPVQIHNQKIEVAYKENLPGQILRVESDWSAASYFYAYVALTGKSVVLRSFEKNSIQGDRIVTELFKPFGVKTLFRNGNLLLEKETKPLPGEMQIDCTDFPDLAQTLAVTCLALKIPCRLEGLKTLRIKETDRIRALENELRKFGAQVDSTSESIKIIPPAKLIFPGNGIETYNDHRMSMSFALMQHIFPRLIIRNPENVVKSFPGFWEQWAKLT